MSGASSSDRTRDVEHADIGHVPTLDAADPTPRAVAAATVATEASPPLHGPLTDLRSPGAARAAVLRPGDTLGRFVVRAELGRGGMGVVYAADDTTLGREVALKVLAIEDDPEPRKRFLREARSAAVLGDPGIATVYDVGEDAGRVFIAMELVRGRTLRALLDARPSDARALPIADALRIAREAARALGVAHARGVVHRDLKPENVMIADGGHVKILDFGLAKRTEPTLTTTDGGTATTEDGRILGTPSYMSPEQTKGRPVDARGDVFSLGVMLYEMVTGKRPFDRPTLVEIFVAIDRDEPEPPARLNPRVPAALARVIQQCLRKSPADRYADARVVLRELEPISAAARPPATRARVALAAAVAVAAMGIVALAATRAPSTAAVTPSAVPLAPPDAAVAPAAVTALPLPAAASPEALAAYKQGIAGLRGGKEWASAFEHAVELDPGFAAAHLRLAAVAMAEAVPSAREHFRQAEEHAASLSERDRALLDAIEPVVRRQPADWAESNKRLAALVERWPGDAELWFYLGHGTANFSDFEAGARCFAKAIEIDPGFTRAYSNMSMDYAYLGRFDDSRRTIDRCLSVSSASPVCLSHLGLIQSTLGDCEGLEVTARRLIASGAQPGMGYWLLAQALAARGQSISTVREALKQAADIIAANPSVKPEDRERRADEDAVALALLAGDFEAVEKLAPAYEKRAAASHRQDDHGSVALGAANVLSEEGRDKEAAAAALDFLDRRDAWEPNPGAEDVAMARDATPSLLVFAVHGGSLTREGAAARRAAWLDTWTKRVTPVSKNFLWPHGYARAVADEADAREAVAALPRYGSLPPFRPLTPVDADVGRTFLLAGRADEAVAWLERYTKSCSLLYEVIPQTRAQLWLGKAREAKGDTAGACAAYRVVIERWGKAKPKSVTADAARERVKALRCGI
jgi:serine/threonine-protein kinase